MRISILTLSLFFIIASCQKSSVKPASNTSSATSENHDLAIRSNFDFLTAHPWVYYRYYVGYVDSSNLGTLQYRRGSKHNITDLDSVTVSYNADGSVDEYDGNGIYTPGTWRFPDNTQSSIVITNSYGVFTTTIVRLDRYRFNWYYTDIYGVKRYGEQINSNLLK